MAKKGTAIESKSRRKARLDGYANGRGKNQAFTSGAQDVPIVGDKRKSTEKHKQAWDDKTPVKTYTSSSTGRMSTNGRTAGGSTWTFTQKNADGTKKQSGRNKIATRRQRYYDIRVGLGLAGG